MGFDLSFESRLAESAEVVWAALRTLEGVNRELAPWVHMTAPESARGRTLEEAPLGSPAFASFLLAFRLLPFDRHELTLVAAERGHFLERSRSWLQRVWEHERSVEAIPGGCRVRDRLHVEPRLGPEALVREVVRALFRWRHYRLERQFGMIP